MNNYSQTQLANFNSAAALLVIILSKFGVSASISDTAFYLGLAWGICATAYNYYQRYSKGDISPLGARYN